MIKRILSCALALLMLLALAAVPALALDEALTVEVPVKVTCKGDAKSDSVTVELAAVTAGAPLPAGAVDGVYTQAVTGSGDVKFTMSYTDIGIYNYTIRQLPGSNPKAIYDSSVYKLTVYVSVAEDGTVGATTVLEDPKGDKVDTAVFTNTYPDDEILPAYLDPPVKKKVLSYNGTAPANSPFIFAMTPAEKGYPMPDNKEAETDPETGALYMTKYGPGEYEFGWMTFDETHVGKTFVYTIREIPGTDRYQYSTEIYTLTVKVSLVGNQVTLDVSYKDHSGAEVTSPEFSNVYQDYTPTPTPTPPVPTPPAPTPPVPTPPAPTPPAPTTPVPSPVTPTPETGDNTNLTLWIVLLAVSAVVVCVAIVAVKKKQNG
ncbi:MAG: hypothetical protein IKE62_03435 [Oscillospiraceae bacterium]|nr:hypothetical protein [Oscillospiraceae bacterium]